MNYIISPIIQIVDTNGKPVVGGKIYVYNHATTTLATTYSDFEYHQNTNPVLTDSLGNCTIIVPEDYFYDIVVKDDNDELLFSKVNLNSGNQGTPQFQHDYAITNGQGITTTSRELLDGTMQFTVALNQEIIDDIETLKDRADDHDELINTAGGLIREVAIDLDDTKNRVDVLETRPIPVQSDWNQTLATDLSYIKNKPEVYTKSETDSLIGNSKPIMNNYHIDWSGDYNIIHEDDNYKLYYFSPAANSISFAIEPKKDYQLMQMNCQIPQALMWTPYYTNLPVGQKATFISGGLNSGYRFNEFRISFADADGNVSMNKFIGIKGQKSNEFIPGTTIHYDELQIVKEGEVSWKAY